jgi:hypothetical protein
LNIYFLFSGFRWEIIFTLRNVSFLIKPLKEIKIVE